MHFDDVISNYREKELLLEKPPSNITLIFDKCIDIIKSKHGDHLKFKHPHVIDLRQDGYIGIII